jgi:hypothetical protein
MRKNNAKRRCSLQLPRGVVSFSMSSPTGPRVGLRITFLRLFLLRVATRGPVGEDMQKLNVVMIVTIDRASANSWKYFSKSIEMFCGLWSCTTL